MKQHAELRRECRILQTTWKDSAHRLPLAAYAQRDPAGDFSSQALHRGQPVPRAEPDDGRGSLFL